MATRTIHWAKADILKVQVHLNASRLCLSRMHFWVLKRNLEIFFRFDLCTRKPPKK